VLRNYARILLDLARDKGLKGIVASNGATGLSLARRYNLTAISLDILLPDIHGWAVHRQLKLNPSTRHIPIQIITVVEERQHGLAHGAFAYYVKEPTTEGLKTALDRLKDFSAPRTKRLLIVEDNEIERQSIIELLGYEDIEIVTVATGVEAIDALTHSAFDCMMLDLRLPDMTGFALLERIHGSSEILRGRKVLVADDDARNIFALASLLENHEMEVITATSGRMAIELVAQTPDLSIVLMDIMMPDMDGYETIRHIREDPRFRTLPILALTAKAMKGDREKCLDAGASDYISKPVDTDHLLSLMRVWLFR